MRRLRKAVTSSSILPNVFKFPSNFCIKNWTMKAKSLAVGLARVFGETAAGKPWVER